MGVICTHRNVGQGFPMPHYGWEQAVAAFGIQPGDRVLDVGGGDMPFERANVVTDAFLSDSHHRGGRPVRKDKQYVECRVEQMPFADKEFDFVYCNHVLEHTDDPIAACRELMRVAKRGYIEVPCYWAEYVFSDTVHYWQIDWVEGELLFRRKPYLQERREDTPFKGIVHKYWAENRLTFLHDWQMWHRNLWTIQLLWDGDGFPVRVEELPPEAIAASPEGLQPQARLIDGVQVPHSNAFGRVYPMGFEAAWTEELNVRPADRLLLVGTDEHHLERSHESAHPENLDSLPFPDRTFDFVACLDALAFVEDPGRGCEELMRVAKRGLIEVPHAWSAYMLGHPAHRWVVELTDGVLTFRRRRFMDSPFKGILRGEYFTDPDFRYRYDVAYRNVSRIQLQWSGRFAYRVIDEGREIDADDPKQLAWSYARYAHFDQMHGVPEETIKALLERASELAPDAAGSHDGAMPPDPDLKPGISAIVHTLNEEARVEAALESLKGWVDEIIVVDMHSDDRTVEIARRYTDRVFLHERIRDFDAARNYSASLAKHQWVFYLDADERVPAELGRQLHDLVRRPDSTFAAVQLPYRNHFAGKWIEHSGEWWPGYKAPMLLRTGYFHWGGRMHSPAHIRGAAVKFPCDDPELGIVHYSYDSVNHLLSKQNTYTEAEADYHDEDGRKFHWKRAVMGFVHDYLLYYDRTRGDQDGPHGFLLAFFGGFYQFATQAKLFERHYLQGELAPEESEVPGDLREVIEFALSLLPNLEAEYVVPSCDPAPAPPTPHLPAELSSFGHPDPDLKPGISAIVHTLNEEARVEAALESLKGWVDEIIVVDMHSDDRTVEIARRYTDRVFLHERIRDFDAARNYSASLAKHQWVFYLDADERVPTELASEIRRQVETAPDEVAAVYYPRKNVYVGKWIEHAGQWWPGYTAPMLLRNGHFWFPGKMHGGVAVSGQAIRPVCGPDKALVHYSYDRVSDNIRKLVTYTDAEAAYLDESGAQFDWRWAIEGFVRDFRFYYDQTQGYKDGPHGFILAFFAGLYRFTTYAKLFERHHRAGTLTPQELAVPASLRDILAYALGLLGGPSRNEPALLWQAPLFDPSGYADEARNFLLGLDDLGVEVTALPLNWSPRQAPLEDEVRDRLVNMTERELRGNFVNVVHIFPPFFERHPEAQRNIGRTMFETDRIPTEWIAKCNEMDEVWVPSDFNLETFARAGVLPHKLFKVPGTLDPTRFAAKIDPLEIEGKRAFNFLSLFDWSLRKGWDILLKAYVEEFTPEDDVALILKIYSSGGMTSEDIQARILAYLAETLGRDPERIPDIIFLDSMLTEEAMLRLYRASDAYVMPSRGEGWGRPLMEAMAMGLPTIGTGWSGNTEFMTHENSYLIDYELVEASDEACREAPTFRGHRWAEPSLPHLRSLMRQVFEHPDEARVRGALGRQDVLTKLDRQVVARRIQERLSATPQRPVRGVWEGEQFVHHSLAYVNRELGLELMATGRVELSLQPIGAPQFDASADPRFAALQARIGAPLSGPTDFHLRHQFPPDFTPPPEGHWIMIQPWEFGGMPEEWRHHMRQAVDEVWVPTQFVRDCYVRSGLDPERVHVVPNGVDLRLFTPDGPRAALPTRKSFKFLYVGGTILRKGVDILVSAYLDAFTADDDVCLIIKDFCVQSVYSETNLASFIELARQRPNAPEIVYLNEDLPGEELAALYRGCDALVHPYRGEGFGLPIAEAMACGLPVLVPNYGACLDFCDSETAILIPAQIVPLPQLQDPPACEIGYWVSEIQHEDLVEVMRKAFREPERGRAIGSRASERIRGAFTWHRAAEIVMERLEALQDKPIVRFLADYADPRHFHPAVAPLEIEGLRDFNFLAFPTWTMSDLVALLTPYVRAFAPQDDVAMLLRLDPKGGVTSEQGQDRLLDALNAMGVSPENVPDILLLDLPLTPDREAALFTTCQALVSTEDARFDRKADACGLKVLKHPTASDLRRARSARLGV